VQLRTASRTEQKSVSDDGKRRDRRGERADARDANQYDDFPAHSGGRETTAPNQSEVRFVYSHKLSDFSFVVRKSPSGFNVTVSPLLPEKAAIGDESEISPAFSAPNASESSPILSNVPFLNSPPIDSVFRENSFGAFESSRAADENNLILRRIWKQ
jgi:hypothetical protein